MRLAAMAHGVALAAYQILPALCVAA